MNKQSEAFLCIILLAALLFSITKFLHDVHLEFGSESAHSKPRRDQFTQFTNKFQGTVTNKEEKSHGVKQFANNLDHIDNAVDTCHVKLSSSTCRMSKHLTKYWSDDADCFPSPLRMPSSKLRVEDRRYVVMQPDLGGWNNIRMALEVGLLFAWITGRISSFLHQLCCTSFTKTRNGKITSPHLLIS